MDETFYERKFYPLKNWIACCNCRGIFEVSTTPLCDGCGEKKTRTIACPYCGKCACDRIEKWQESGKLVPMANSRFDWVHQDLIRTNETP